MDSITHDTFSRLIHVSLLCSFPLRVFGSFRSEILWEGVLGNTIREFCWCFLVLDAFVFSLLFCCLFFWSSQVTVVSVWLKRKEQSLEENFLDFNTSFEKGFLQESVSFGRILIGVFSYGRSWLPVVALFCRCLGAVLRCFYWWFRLFFLYHSWSFWVGGLRIIWVR